MTDWRASFRTPGRSPRDLLLGPAGAGKTTLVTAALASAFPNTGRRQGPDVGSVAWTDVAGGVIVDVPGSLAFPPGDRDLRAWERLVRQLRRLRPRRPIDGVILAIPASLLLDPALEEERVHLAAAIRERFALAQSLLGLTVPAYVVITKADEIRGFDTFTRTLSDEQLRNMLGWSNPHGTEQGFVGAWVAEGVDTLHDAIVRVQVQRFASSTQLEDSADLFLFSGQVRQLEPALRVLLEEVFRPSLYHEAFYCRGVYLCGRSTTTASINFLDDLLANKVFAERGLATPLSDVAVVRKRSGTIAQVVCALLVVVLAAGMYWGYTRLRRGQAEFVSLLNKSDAILFERRRAVANGRPLSVRYRLDQSRGLLDDELQRINNDRLSWVVYRLNPTLRPTLTRIFGDIVLDDFRAGLEARGSRWLSDAGARPDDPAPSGPNFQDRARYKMLAHFAQEYSPFVQNYHRYDQLRRVDGSGDIGSLARLSEYLDGTSLKIQALGRPYARALRDANAAPINCAIFEDSRHESLVNRHASELLDEFSAWSFDEKNPVRTAALDFTEDWIEVSRGSGGRQDLDSLISHTAALADAARAWTALGSGAADEPIALFEQAPFMPHPANTGLCEGLLWPDLGDRLQQVQQARAALSQELLGLEVEPFGPLFKDKQPGLALADPLAALKKELDTLQAQSFWSASVHTADTPLRSLPPFATWRSEDVDEAVKTADAFENYRGAAFDELEGSSRTALLDVVTSAVAELVGTRLQRTATGGSELPGDSGAMSEQVKVLGSVITRLGRIAPLLSRSPSGGIILNALNSQATAALNAVNRDAVREYPWLFAWPRRATLLDGLFTRWQEIRRTAPAADATKLWEAVADEQRDAVPRYATLARPLATYLVARRSLSEPALRWTRIGRDAANFEQKLPDTALSALDSLMRKGIPSTVPANNCDAGVTGTARATGEYFGPLRDEIARESERQCRQQVQRDYSAIASVFNQQLRDRFPFVEGSAPTFAGRVRAAEGRAEATPAGVKALIDAYKTVDGLSLTRFLEARRTCSTDPAVAFLHGVDSASRLLASAADPLLKTPMIVLDLRPEFRLSADPGRGGDQIAEWRMEVGSRMAREPVATADPLPWTSGDKVSVVVRFARDSPSVPTADAGVPARSSGLDDRTVRFDFSGGWALFQLLLARTIPRPADVLRLGEVPQTVLAFEIPVRPDSGKPPLGEAAPGSPFEVYIRLGIFSHGKTEALTVDPLPTQAPATVRCIGS